MCVCVCVCVCAHARMYLYNLYHPAFIYGVKNYLSLVGLQGCSNISRDKRLAGNYRCVSHSQDLQGISLWPFASIYSAENSALPLCSSFQKVL